MYGGRQRAQDNVFLGVAAEHHVTVAPKKTASVSHKPAWGCRSCVGDDGTAHRMLGSATHCTKCNCPKGTCHKALPLRGAPKSTCAERQLWNERIAKKKEKKAKENEERREKRVAALDAAKNNCPLGASAVGETAENAASAEDLVSVTFKFHCKNGAI